jgi:glycosyltransferase involved in cell wall biosynthesis
MKMDSLSVFFPAYNEEANIVATVEKAISVLKNLEIKNWEIIIINDGSKDKTGEKAELLAKENKNVRVLNQPNGGYGMALRAGYYYAKYPYIVYTDSDGQFDFSEVTRFIEKVDEADLIIGYRIKRSDPFIRLIFAKGWAISLFIFFGIWLKDVDCGFKMVNKKVLEKIPPLESTRGGMINAELIIKARNAGFKIVQVGVHHYPRIAGKPTGASLQVIIKSFVDLFKLRLKTL